MNAPNRSNETPAGPEGVPGEWFNEAYESTPRWEIGRPQSEVGRLLAEGKLRGRILDLGCGTGESSFLLARTGATVMGVDFAQAAIEKALAKQRTRGISGVEFRVQSALEMDFAQCFENIVDMGVFHVFSDAQRPTYRAAVARALVPGGGLSIVCFSEHQPGGGPRRVRQDELRELFQNDFDIRSIRAARYDTVEGFAHAWLMEATKR